MNWIRSYSLFQNRQPTTQLQTNNNHPTHDAQRGNCITNSTANLTCSTSVVVNNDYDPQACYDSFKEHWHQSLKIIQRRKSEQTPINHDDILSAVNHLEQMVILLMYDVSKIDQGYAAANATTSSSVKCLKYMLNEEILEKLFDWSEQTGKYINVLRCEQLKIYDCLINRSRHVLLLQDGFLRPLLKFLNACQTTVVITAEIEKLLVTVLNQLCALLMQHTDLIDLFVTTTNDTTKFIIFSLLLPYIHRDDSIGMQARDALLLCMSLSKKKKHIAIYVAEVSNFSILVATGLNGLYSALPNCLDDISVPDWHRLTPDDVNDINGLATFVTSLEFCNAVTQVAHPIIRKQLQEFFYRGFLIHVLGPALLQTNADEQIAAIAYLELILRTVSQPGLLYVTLQFLLKVECDQHQQQLIDVLVDRINSDRTLCLVTLSLFETLVDLNCEDLMLHLVFQNLQPCLHLMLSQRRLNLPLDPHCHSFEKLLNLAPSSCDFLNASIKSEQNIHWNTYANHHSMFGKYHAYLLDARNRITACQTSCSTWTHSYTGCETDISPNTDETFNSLPSLGESSGYESLKFKLDDKDVPSENLSGTQSMWQQLCPSNVKPTKKCTTDTNNTSDQLKSQGTAGSFLTILLNKLKQFLSNSFYINLHVTGLISRLAVYPQPLLRTYLLDHNLVLQPNVPSLFEIIGSLKQSVDEYLYNTTNSVVLLTFAKDFLVEREAKLINLRRNYAADQKTPTSEPNLNCDTQCEPLHRNETKRKSLKLSSSITNMFTRKSNNMQHYNDDQHDERTSAIGTTTVPLAFYHEDDERNLARYNFTEAEHIALCAVLLDEWVKELAALAQEHTIAQLAAILK